MLESIKTYVELHKDNYIRLLMDYVGKPSEASKPDDIRHCVDFLQATMEEAGINTRVFPTRGNPIVYGELRAQRTDAPTILFYGHYDVQPTDPVSAWTSPPFDATLREGRIYGRGVGDNKGQHLAHILAVKACVDIFGEVSAHLKFVLEGEEEAGSGSLADFVMSHRELLQADIVYVSDGPMHETDVPIICFGNRGVFNFGVEVCTATTDHHSGNKGGIIPNAAWELVRLLSSMTDDTGKVKVEGFYDDMIPPSDYEQELIAKLPYHPAEFAKIYGVEKLEISKQEYYNNLCFQPTLSINALGSGSPEETKNIIPGRALAKLDIRLVANQNPIHIFECIKAHAQKQDIKGIVRVFHEGEDMYPSKTDARLSICRKIMDIVGEAFGQEPLVLPVAGGSLPSSVWTELLSLPVISVPYANVDENNHAPDENLRVDCFLQGILTTAMVIHKLDNR